MPGLGLLFGERPITGPNLVEYTVFQGVHIYMIGERHDKNGNVERKSDHVVEKIMAFSANNKSACYIESTDGHARDAFTVIKDRMKREHTKDILKVADSPLFSYIGYMGMNDMSSVSTVMADIRNDTPYNIYTLLTNTDFYIYENYGFNKTNDDLKKVRKLAKLAEKAIVRNIPTRIKAAEFFDSLYLPDVQYPEWFVSLYQTIAGNNIYPPSPLKDKMNALRTLSLSDYDSVTRHVRSLYRVWKMTPLPFTVAMERVESMRHTKSNALVAQTSEDAHRLFLELGSYLFEINVIVDILIKIRNKTYDAGDSVVILCGMKHAASIGLYFGCGINLPIYHKIDKGYEGTIPAGEANNGTYMLPNMAARPILNLNNKPKVQR